MSFWGATVITNLMSAIPWVGQDIVEFIWGGFSVNNATLSRFFSLHFLLPFVIAALVLMHLAALHDTAGSTNPLCITGNIDRVSFAPYYIFKDLISFFGYILVLSFFVFFMPNVLGDSENYVMANPMQTPAAIVPEWYLLPFYALLRSIPNKLYGVIAMFSAILILLILPLVDLGKIKGMVFRPLSKIAYYVFVANFLALMLLGAKHVESPFIEVGQNTSILYFSYFLAMIPIFTLLENTFMDLALNQIAPRYNYGVASLNSDLLIKEWIAKLWTRCKLMLKVAVTLSFLGYFIIRLSVIMWDYNPLCSLKNSVVYIIDFLEKIIIRVWLFYLPRDNDNEDIIEIYKKIADIYGPETENGKLTIKVYKNEHGYFCIERLRGDYSDESEDGNGKDSVNGSGSGSNSSGDGSGSNSSGGGSDYSGDAPHPWGLYFQDSASPQMEGIIELHDNILFYLFIILFGVGWILMYIILSFQNNSSPITSKYLNHGTLIELIWTITPALILILIAFPSFKLLYLMDEVNDPAMTVLAEGFLFLGGLILYILNKIKEARNILSGEKNHTLVYYKLAQIKYMYSLYSGFKLNKINNKIGFSRTFHTKVRASKRIGPHNEEILSVIIGSLLGDAYANARTIEGTRICYRQSERHIKYLLWLYDFFYTKGYCSNLKPRKSLVKTKNISFYRYEFNTFTFRSFNWIHKLFYKKGKKYINPKIGQYLTPLALAIWIMDDGCWIGKSGVRIATNCFNIEEVKFLRNMLINIYKLNCTIQNIDDRYSIYITKESIPKLRNILLPFMHNSMRYKLGLKNV
jgi:uncharacterized membrane protein YgcG